MNAVPATIAVCIRPLTELTLSFLVWQDLPTVLGSSGKTIKSDADDRVFVYYRQALHTSCEARAGL